MTIDEMIKYLKTNFGYPKDFVFAITNINMMIMDYTSIGGNNPETYFDYELNKFIIE